MKLLKEKKVELIFSFAELFVTIFLNELFNA